jgi:hypothetical protein
LWVIESTATALFDGPQRCVHIGERESEIHELFCTAQKASMHFLLRTCVDRPAGDGNHTIRDEMDRVRVQDLYRIQSRDKKGNMFEAVLKIRYHRIRVLPPIGKQKQYPEMRLTVIYAQEGGTPQDREKVDWRLITDVPVHSRRDAIEKLEWYAQRWKIEVSQDPEVLLQSGRVEAAYGGAAG